MRVFCNGQQAHLVTLEIKQPVFSSDLNLLLWMAILGSAGAMLGAVAIALAPARWRAPVLPLLLAYSAGTMLAAALLGMLPKAMNSLPPMHGGATVLLGLLAFFALERWLMWHHCHEPTCHVRQSTGKLLLVGDAFHNFVDGVLIAAAFLTGPEWGWAATLAVIAHEVPQEMGDYAVLLESGMGRWQALSWNLLSALSTLPGALLGYWMLSDIKACVPYLLAVSGASFLYIALGDLLPSLHKRQQHSLLSLLMLLLGILTIVLIRAGKS